MPHPLISFKILGFFIKILDIMRLNALKRHGYAVSALGHLVFLKTGPLFGQGVITGTVFSPATARGPGGGLLPLFLPLP